MSTPSRPSAPSHGVAVRDVTVISGPPLSPVQQVLGLVGLLLLLWIAYRIGKVILSLVVGLLFFGLLVFGVWYFFIR